MSYPARWPPAVRAILWMDAVLLVGAALVIAGKPPGIGAGTDPWTWLALAGSVLTAVLAALAAFHLCAPGEHPGWMALPVPAMVLWAAATLLGYVTLPADAHPWGETLAQSGECLAFLLTCGLPLLALIVFMLWRAAPVLPRRVLAMGALASAGAAASLLTLVHPHAPAFADLCAHGTAFVVLLGIGAAFARARRAS
jgi:hypothetical protein